MFDAGVEKGHFTSRYQRSIYNVDAITAQPWWTNQEAQYVDAAK